MKFWEAMKVLAEGHQVRPILPGDETICISRKCDFIITKESVGADWEVYDESVQLNPETYQRFQKEMAAHKSKDWILGKMR